MNELHPAQSCITRVVAATIGDAIAALDAAEHHGGVIVPQGRLVIAGPLSLDDQPGTAWTLHRCSVDVEVGRSHIPSHLDVAPWSATKVELILRPVWRKHRVYRPALMDRYYAVAHSALDQLKANVEAGAGVDRGMACSRN